MNQAIEVALALNPRVLEAREQITEFESRLMALATPAIIQSSDNPGPSLRREKASSVGAGCRGRPREWPAICEVTCQSLKALEAALLLLSGLEWPEVAP